MNRFIVLVIVTALAAAGCSSTFLVSKNGQAYFLGSDAAAARRLLCDSGDLKKILGETSLPEQTKGDLLRYSCSADGSREKVKQVFAAMTPEQRKDLRTAFKNNDYDINYVHC